MTNWIAVDPVLRTFWIRANLGDWSGGIAPDLVAGSGGFDIGFANDIYSAMVVPRPGEKATALLAATSGPAPAPPGCGEVNTSAIPIRPWVTAYIFT